MSAAADSMFSMNNVRQAHQASNAVFYNETPIEDNSDREVYLLFSRQSAKDYIVFKREKDSAHMKFVRFIMNNQDISHCDFIFKVGCEGHEHCKWQVAEGSDEDKMRCKRAQRRSGDSATTVNRESTKASHEGFYHYIRVLVHDNGFDWRMFNPIKCEVAERSFTREQLDAAAEDANKCAESSELLSEIKRSEYDDRGGRVLNRLISVDRMSKLQHGDKPVYESFQIKVSEFQYRRIVEFVLQMRILDGDGVFTYDWDGVTTNYVHRRWLSCICDCCCASCDPITWDDVYTARERNGMAVLTKLTCISFVLNAFANAGVTTFRQFSITGTTPEELYKRCVNMTTSGNSDLLEKIKDVETIGTKIPCMKLWDETHNRFVYPLLSKNEIEMMTSSKKPIHDAAFDPFTCGPAMHDYDDNNISDKIPLFFRL